MKLLLPFLAAIALVSSCANYKATTLNRLDPEFTPASQKIGDVTLAAKTFTLQDCKKYLDRDVLEEGYVPIQITIINQSNKQYIFSPSMINMPSATPDQVAVLVETSTVGRATSYGVGALFWRPLAIPAVVDGVKSHEANEELDKDYATKDLGNEVIQPYSTLNGLIFVPKESYKSNLSLTIADKNGNDKLPFSVDIGEI